MRSSNGYTWLWFGGVPLVCGLLALSVWQYEIFESKGYEGLAWLHSYPWAAVFTCLMWGVAMGLPGALHTRKFHRIATSCLALAASAWLAFEIAKSIIYAMHQRPFPAIQAGFGWGFLVLLGIALCLAAYLTMRTFYKSLDRRYLFWITAGMAGGMIGSILTIEVFPAPGGHTDYIHVVKLGYPTFWLVFLPGLATWMSFSRLKRRRNVRSHD